MLKRSSLPVLLSILVQVANAQWHQRTLIATHTDYYNESFFTPRDLHFSDKKNGFIIGGNMIMKYNGTQWLPLSRPGATENFRGVYSLNATNTFFVGDYGAVYKYNGQSFKKIDVHNDNHFSGIFVSDSNNVWISGSGGTILHLVGDSVITDTSSYPFELERIYMDKADHGWTFCTRSIWQQGIQYYYGTIYEFKNKKWAEHSSVNGLMTDIAFTPSGEGYISSSENVYHFSKTRDKWEAVFSQPLTQPVKSISFANDNLGIAMQIDSSYLLFKNGKWTAQQAVLTNMVAVQFGDSASVWAVSTHPSSFDYYDKKNHLIYFLKDTGWQQISLKYLDTVRTEPWKGPFQSVSSFGKKNLRLNGFLINIPDSAEWIDTLKTMDPPLDSFVSVKQYNETIAWTHDGQNLVSAKGNQFAYHRLFPNPDPNYWGCVIFNTYYFQDTAVWATGLKFPSDPDAGFLPFLAYYDNAKGSVTKEYYPATQKEPYKVHFSDKDNGWCVGDSGLILHYSNNNWQMRNFPTDEFLATVFTLDAQNAWAAGGHGTLLKYDGTTWTKVNINTTQDIYSIFFTDKNHGWMVGEGGMMYKYDGSSWKQDTTITDKTLIDIFMESPKYGWAVGDEGTILQYINTDTTGDGRIAPTGIPSTIFPNPSSDNTTIEFNLKKAGNTVINLFSQQGNKLATYNLGMLEAGKSSKTISISSLQEGTYFYEIISDGKRGKGKFIKVH